MNYLKLRRAQWILASFVGSSLFLMAFSGIDLRVSRFFYDRGFAAAGQGWQTILHEGMGWFLGFHCITKYVKVAFFGGASLSPMPPVASKQKDVRYFHIHEGDWGGQLDEALVVSWIRQASELPGENLF